MPFFFSSARSPTATDHENDDDDDGGEERGDTTTNNAGASHEDTVQNKNNSNSIGTRIRTFLLLHVLTALLPPVESKDELKKSEYYKVLGLDNDKKTNRRNVTAEQIRKAYKTKSLALHPDKVAQRQARQRRHRNSSTNNNAAAAAENAENNLTEEQAAELFLKVQEAHAVLSDAHNRHVYHEFGCSPARYKFVHDSEGDGSSFALHHPMMLYENLTQASCVNKTRLVSVFTLFILLALLQPILICAKINQELKNASGHGALQDTPWSVILIPFWIVYGVLFLSLQFLLTCCWLRNNWQVRWFALQHLLFLIGMILLVQVWDGQRTSSSVNWHAMATPFYMAIFCRVAGMAATARELLDVVHSRMASLEHLQQTEPRPVRARRNHSNGNDNKSNGSNNNNDNDNENGADTDAEDDDDDEFLTEDEWIAQLSEKYVIVTPDPHIVEAHITLWHEEHDQENNNEEPASDEIPEEEMESIRIASSPEYQSAMEQVQSLQRSAGNVFVYGIVMVALIAAKLTPSQLGAAGRGASWWAIFTPIWIFLALQMMSAVSMCCCSGLTAGSNDNVIILAAAAASATSGESQRTPAAGHDVENQPGGVSATTPSATTATTTSSPNNKEQFQNEHSKSQAQKERVASSVKWANAEGSMDLPSIAVVAPTPRAADGDDDNASLTPSDEGYFGQKKLADPPGMLAEEVVVVQQQQEDPPQQDPPGVDAATALAGGNGQGDSSSGVVSGIMPASNGGEQQQPRGVGGSRDGDGHHDDEGDEREMPPHHNFDEETFHRWQQAHAAAESSAHEAQAKGQWQCCVAIFQLIVLCLVVGKLQDDYHPEQQQGDDDPSSHTGYNAFWILFPIFFVAGILVCCCSCLIYSAGSASGLDDLVASAKKNDEAGNHESNVNQPGTTATNNNNNNNNNMPANKNGSSATIPLAASTEETTTTTTTQGEMPGQPVVTKSPATAAGAAAGASATATVAGTVGGGGGDIENAMDDLD